jgi:sulfoxide reductase heme-binding subunit YedZ
VIGAARAYAIELALGAGFGVALAAIGVSAQGDDDAYTYAWAWTRGVGWLALSCLAAALCVSPLVRLARTLRPGRAVTEGRGMRWRRGLGVAACGGGLIHAASALKAVPGSEAFDTPGLRAGLACLLILAALGATSFPRVVRRLRLRNWKELHRLAYVAFPIAVFHALQSPFAPLRGLLWLGAGVLLLAQLRWLPKRSGANDRGVAVDPEAQ